MEKPFQFLASHVALDFANTLDSRFAPSGPSELLLSYGDLVRFCGEAGLFEPSIVSVLSYGTGYAQANTLDQAIELREAIYSIFAAVAQHHAPQLLDLKTLNRQLTAALPHRQIVRNGEDFVWTWEGVDIDPSSPLWPLAFASAELMTSPDCGLVRECQSETCRWLFLDHSKNHSRRWCDMRSCGNRVKARRFHKRHAANSP